MDIAFKLMIHLEHPVNFRKYYLVFRKVWNNEKNDFLEDRDLSRFYEAKANLFNKIWEDSGKKDDRAFWKSINAIITFGELEKAPDYKNLV